MARRGLARYSQEEVRRNVHILYDDVVKKARNSRQSMWDMIYQARVAYMAANPDLECVIESPKWPLPGAQELGSPTTSAKKNWHYTATHCIPTLYALCVLQREHLH